MGGDSTGTFARLVRAGIAEYQDARNMDSGYQLLGSKRSCLLYRVILLPGIFWEENLMKTIATAPREARWSIVFLIAALLVLLFPATAVHALNGFPDDFLAHYPQAGPTLTAAAENCTLCHTDVNTNPTNDLNSYGLDIEPAGNNTIDARLTAVETLNSDGDAAGTDACDNITEINADTLPGDASSTPANCGTATVCGNGTVEAGEDCDDGNTADGDCCSSTCQFEAAGSACPDGVFCNGGETCDGAGSCQAGTPVDCSDGVGCTEDVCDEAADACVSTPNDANCPDDGLFCNGNEFCDAVNDCSSTGDPCPAGEVCDESTDVCTPQVACGNGIVEAGEECDDGNNDPGDCCAADCTFEATGSTCGDGQFCNGDEICDGAGTCLEGTPVDCGDGVACTADSCNEVTDSCENTPDNTVCDNGVFCDGVERCDAVNDCQPGTPVDCDDGVGCTDDACDEASDACVNAPNDTNCPDDGAFCNGNEFCDAVNDCSSDGDPCPVGTTCDEANDTCEAVPVCGDGNLDDGEQCDDGNTLSGDCCDMNCQFETAGSSCADGSFCNGEELCDGAGACQPGTPVDCDDGVSCTVDTCDEVNNACANTPNDNLCADDGQFCNGQEVCDVVNDCVSEGDPCPAGSTCDEAADVCVGPLVDLDLRQFKVNKNGRVDRSIRIRLVVKNNGTTEGEAQATVIGMQNGMKVYEVSMAVSDGVGNGQTRESFPPFVPSEPGVISWTAEVADANPDRATATTNVR